MCTAFSFYLHLVSPNVADLDGFYHFGHAEVYREHGLKDSSFPWTEFSVVKTYRADVWYGFHVLLLPFTYVADKIQGMRAAAIGVTATSVFLIFLAFRNLNLRWPIFWTFLTIFSSPDFFYRLSALRPQLISFGLIFLLLSYLFKFKEQNKKTTIAIIFAISLAISWIHLAFIWMPLAIWVVFSLVSRLLSRQINFYQVLSIISGTLAGIILRPNPGGAINLTYIQVVRLLWEKYQKTPLLFGTEVLRFTRENFWDQFIPITLLLVIAIFVLLVVRHNRTVKSLIFSTDFGKQLWTNIILASFFFWLSFTSARRSSDFFFGFSVVFIGLIVSRTWPWFKRLFSLQVIWNMATVFSLVVIITAGISARRYVHAKQVAYSPETSREAAVWLAQNSLPESIVFHPFWDQFGPLFFWNKSNHYINGMDPIFEYDYSPSLYWKHHFLSTGQTTTFTCGYIRCTADMVEDSYRVLQEDFRADFVYIQKKRSRQLLAYLENDSRYQKVFENGEDAIFSLKGKIGY